MADYNLGTAHGKIVVDYQDKGTGKAAKDLDGLKAKAGELLSKFAGLASGWRSHSQGMVNDFTKLTKVVGVFSGGLAVAAGVLGKSKNSFLVFKGVNQIFSSLGLAMGSVPKGAEGFPGVVKKVIQLSAAISVFTGSTKLIQTVFSRFSLLKGLGNLIGGFGSKVDGLTAPIQKFAKVALAAANGVVAFRIVGSLVKPVLAFGGALAVVGGAAHLLAGLVSSIRDLSGAALLLPAILGAAGLAALTFKIGISGLSDAFKALDDPAKFAEALKNLSPAAREFAVAVREIYTKGFKELKLDVQERLFKGLGKVVQDLGGKYLPVLQDVMGRVADHLNGVAFGIGGVLKSGEGFTNLSVSLGLFEKIIGNVGKAVPQLLRALLGIMRISAQVFEPLTRGAGDAAKRFADFVNSAEGATKIKKWIESGVQALKDLWGIVKNVALALSSMWTGLNGGEAQSFLGTLNQLTAKFNEFIRSAAGQRVLALLGDQFEKLWTSAEKLGGAFVDNVLPALEKFLPIAAQISSGVIDGLVVAMKILGPLFSVLATILAPLAPVLGEIVKWLVAIGATAAGVAVAVGILYKTFTLLKVAVDAFKVAATVASFATRVLTGSLTAADLAALKFAGSIGKKAASGILTFVKNSKLIKGAGIALALGAAAVAMDEVNKSAANGAPLTGFEENLSDISGAAQQLASGDFAGIIADMKGEINQLGATWGANQAPVQQWFQKVRDSFNTDFIGFFQGLPAQIAGWLAGVGTSFQTALVDPIVAAAGRVKTSFMTDFVGFFTGLPAMIAGWAAGIATSATTLWQGFVDGARAKFVELGGEVGSLPTRLGTAIGALIGIAISWGINFGTSLLNGAITGIAGFFAWLAALPGRIVTYLVNLGASLYQSAAAAWGRFQEGSVSTGQTFLAWVQGLPGRVASAIAGLAGVVWAAAVNAWNGFYARAQQYGNMAINFARSIPGLIRDGLSALAGYLRERATTALTNFTTAVRTGFAAAVAFVRGIPGQILGALGNVGSILVAAGRSIINGLLAGIRAGVQAMYDFVSGIAAGIAARKGPISYDKRLLIPAGIAIIQGLRQGLAQELPGLYRMVGGIGDTMTGAMNMSGAVNLTGSSSISASGSAALAPAWSGPVSGSDGSSAPVTNNYNVTLDAKSVAEMQGVADFFGKVQQQARAGKAGR